jgi:hypothetical protein
MSFDDYMPALSLPAEDRSDKILEQGECLLPKINRYLKS